MKATVLRSFRDKHTKAMHHAGDEMELTSERFSEVNSTRHGVLVSEIPGGESNPPKSDEAQPPVGELDQAENQPAAGEADGQGTADDATVIPPAVIESTAPGKPTKKAKQDKIEE